MFNKKNDILLKITNMFLVIIATISLGVAIGNHFYKENEEITCPYQISNPFTSCHEIKMKDENNNLRTIWVSYSVFGVSLVSLMLCNISGIKEWLKK